jgi:uroporphyrinogen decarboxylase
MNSRQRILNAINHRPVDRVPVDLGGTRQSGIAVQAYAKLKRHLNMAIDRPVRVFDLYQMLAEIDVEIAAYFGSDCIALQRPAVAFGIRNDRWKPFTLFDGTEVEVPHDFLPQCNERGDWVIQRNGTEIARMPKHGFYFDRFEKYPGALHPDLDTWEPPRLPDEDLTHYARQSEHLYHNTDKAVIAAMGPPYELFNGIGQGGFTDWMITFGSEPDYVKALYTKIVDVWIENLRGFREAVGDRIQILQICDDFGTQQGPFLSVDMFRDLLLPAYQRGLDWIHANTPWKVLLHSDGAIRPLLPSIIEMGVDLLNPVQTTATGMDPEILQREFGDKLVFWGGSCDCQGMLTHGTPSEIRREAQQNLGIFQPEQGGMVFASVHNIQANVPPENIEALFDAVRDYSPRSRGNGVRPN